MSFTPNKICYIMKKTTYTTLKRMSCPKASVNLCGWRGAHETWSAECKLVSDFQIKSWWWGHFKFTCKLVKMRINVVIWKGLKMTTKCFSYFFQEMETVFMPLSVGWPCLLLCSIECGESDYVVFLSLSLRKLSASVLMLLKHWIYHVKNPKLDHAEKGAQKIASNSIRTVTGQPGPHKPTWVRGWPWPHEWPQVRPGKWFPSWDQTKVLTMNCGQHEFIVSLSH